MRLLLTIDRFEGNQAVLKTNEGGTIIWPREKLPAGAGEGGILNFLIAGDPRAEDEKKELAKNILNEIIGTEEDKE